MKQERSIFKGYNRELPQPALQSQKGSAYKENVPEYGKDEDQRGRNKAGKGEGSLTLGTLWYTISVD